MSELTINSEISIHSLFGSFFKVPDFQREYVWEESDVENLLMDIITSWKDDQNSDYFIGAIVLAPSEDDKFYIVDGQQRLTTFYLTFCAMLHLDSDGDTNYTSKNDLDAIKKNIFEAKISMKGTEPEYRLHLPDISAMSCLECAYTGDEMEVNENSTSSETIRLSYQTCCGILKSNIKSKEDFSSLFYYITQRVKLLPYVAKNMTQALLVFETLNTRGRGLTQLDLVKNLIFIHADEEDWDSLRESWLEFSNLIEKCRIKASSFLKYFLLSQLGKKVDEDKAFQWVKENANDKRLNLEKDPTGFLSLLTNVAQQLLYLKQGNSVEGSSDPVLSNIKIFVTSASQHYPTLLAIGSLPSNNREIFHRAVESLLISYGVLRMYTGDIEKTFTEWTRAVIPLRGESAAKIQEIYDAEFLPKIRSVGKLAKERLKIADQKDLSSKKLQFILRRLEAHLEGVEQGKYLDINDITPKKKYDIEHIVSKNSKADYSNLGFLNEEEWEDYTNRIGNQSILEKPLNRAIKSKPFPYKKSEGYINSDFFLSCGIVKTLPGKNSKAIAMNSVKSFKGENFGKNEILERQSNLADLAAAAFLWE